MEEKYNNISDNYILDKCFDTTGRIKSSIYKQINNNTEYLNIKQYLEHRYSDIPSELFTYKEVLFHIKHNIEIRPTCQICDKPVQFIGKIPVEINFRLIIQLIQQLAEKNMNVNLQSNMKLKHCKKSTEFQTHSIYRK